MTISPAGPLGGPDPRVKFLLRCTTVLVCFHFLLSLHQVFSRHQTCFKKPIFSTGCDATTGAADALGQTWQMSLPKFISDPANGNWLHPYSKDPFDQLTLQLHGMALNWDVAKLNAPQNNKVPRQHNSWKQKYGLKNERRLGLCVAQHYSLQV